MRPRRRSLWGAGATALALAPLVTLVPAPAPGGSAAGPPASAARVEALAAAAGWRDTLPAYRAPQALYPAGDRVVVLVLDGPAAAAAPAGERAAAAAAVDRRQDAVAAALTSLGATPLTRYRVLLNGMAVRVPPGRMSAVAALADVRAIVPVSLLAPAQAAPSPAGAPLGEGRVASSGTAAGPAHIALIDGPVDASHPWLGGGVGPTFPVLGGADLVDGDADPTAAPADGDLAAHGTQMAGLVLRAPALRGLGPRRTPRLLAYRVLGREQVDGREHVLARSDRVLAALERAVDPDGDGDPRDRAEVILLGVAAGFDGAGTDPIGRSLALADRVGATVVAPAGNDGPTFSLPGSVGGPAAGPTVIAVGGVSSPTTPRAADLRITLGPAEVGLGPLPLMGPAPPATALPVTVLGGAGLPLRGDLPEPWVLADPEGLRGAAVVVARGESIADAAGRASAAGAAALLVWDPAGPASFPGIAAPDLALPVLGLGPDQGAALMSLSEREPGIRVAIAPRTGAAAPPRLASFSSWGPTADGRPKPDLVAPAVDVVSALPGRDAAGGARTGALTGTSAAAASVAARALRLRIDHPGLGPRAVHSVLVQAARPLPGVAAPAQGAGDLGDPPPLPSVSVEPAIVVPREAGRGARVEMTVADLSGRARSVRVVLRHADGRATVLAGPRRLAGGGRMPVRATVVAPARGRIVVIDPAGDALGGAPAIPARRARTAGDALGVPRVRVVPGGAEALVRIGLLERRAAGVRAQRLSGVAFALVPAAGGAPLPVSGAKESGDGAPGTFRIAIGRRLAAGLEVPAGRYRLRVGATGPDGTRLRRHSAPFRLR